MSADVDVAIACMARWKADKNILGLVPGDMRSDLLTPLERQQDPVLQPYARLIVRTSTKGNEYSTHSPDGKGGLTRNYIDYEDVTIEVYGIGKQALGRVISAVDLIFSEQPLTIPNTVAWMRTEDLGRPEVVEDPTRKRGEDMRVGTLQYRVWSHRQVG